MGSLKPTVSVGALTRGVGMLALAFVVAACAPTQSSSPTPAATAAPTAASPAPAGSPVESRASPAASLVAASPVATRAASPVAGPAASPSPAARAGSGATRLTLDPDGSEVRYTVREQLAGRSLPSDAVGTTRSVSGAILLDPSGAPVADQSRISADLRTLQSDESRRDRYIRENTLEVDQFPTAVFVARQVQGLPSPVPTSGEATFQLLGDLTIHGVTRPVTWEATARFGEQDVTGQATTRLKITDFAMQIPRVTLVLSVEDDVRLDLNFRAAREAA